MTERRQAPKQSKRAAARARRGGASLRAKKEPKPKQPLFRVPELAPPAETAPTGKMIGAGKEAQPQQPDRPAGWSMAAASRGWGPLDLSGGGDKLPPPGDYDGMIADLEVIDKSDVLWMIVSFRLDGLEASPAPEVRHDCEPRRPGRPAPGGQGHAASPSPCSATETPLEAIGDPFDLPGLFIGKPLNLTVAHKERDGVPELVVRTIRPR